MTNDQRLPEKLIKVTVSPRVDLGFSLDRSVKEIFENPRNVRSMLLGFASAAVLAGVSWVVVGSESESPTPYVDSSLTPIQELGEIKRVTEVGNIKGWGDKTYLMPKDDINGLIRIYGPHSTNVPLTMGHSDYTIDVRTAVRNEQPLLVERNQKTGECVGVATSDPSLKAVDACAFTEELVRPDQKPQITLPAQQL